MIKFIHINKYITLPNISNENFFSIFSMSIQLFFQSASQYRGNTSLLERITVKKGIFFEFVSYSQRRFR